MKIRPLNDRILVKRLEEEETTKGGIIIPDSAKEKPAEGEIVAVGNGKLNDKGERIPLEVKAGMDPCRIKHEFGDDLVLHGGINAVYWDNKDRIEEEMRRIIPVVMENGGYIFSSDHSVPSTVSLENFRYIVDLAKSLGSYGGLVTK